MAVDLDAIRKKLANMQGSRSNSRVQLWKPGLGEHEVRGLPWPAEKLKDGTPFIELDFYYLGNNSGFLAPAQFGKTDPIDNLRRELFATGKPSDRELAKKLFARTRFYMPVVDRNDPDSGVMVWSFGKLVYQRLLGFFLQDDIGDYLDVEDGFDLNVKITKQQGKRFNDTTVDVARRASPLAPTPEKIKELVDAVPDIDDMYRLKDATEIEGILNAWLGGEAEDDGTATSRGKPAADELDKLAEEVTGNSAEDDVETEESPKEEKAKKKAPKSRKKKATEPAEGEEVKTQTLDEAFDELMEGEDEEG